MHDSSGYHPASVAGCWASDPFFRQPLILAYLIAGFFIGPFSVGLVKSQESISIISNSA
jgi:predicted Kef-type K+ transport protein